LNTINHKTINQIIVFQAIIVSFLSTYQQSVMQELTCLTGMTLQQGLVLF